MASTAEAAVKDADSGSEPVKEESELQDTWKKAAPVFNTKRSSEFFDPCQDFANKSIKCLHRNGGDKDMCQDYFQAYRDCKKEWTLQRKEAKRKAGGGWFS